MRFVSQPYGRVETASQEENNVVGSAKPKRKAEFKPNKSLTLQQLSSRSAIVRSGNLVYQKNLNQRREKRNKITNQR